MTVTFSPPLGTPEQEAALCRAAWKAHPSKWGWHIHHEALAEERTYAVEDRISYILREKPLHEQPLRLRLMRPVLDRDALAAIYKTYSDALAAIYKTYRDALAPIYKTYRDALAPIDKTYSDALAPIYKTYGDALAPIDKTYRDALAALHGRECPVSTWDGMTIFGSIKVASRKAAAK
jgi:hypothetical protein